MSETEERTRILLKRFADNSASAAEISELLDLLRLPEGDAILHSFIMELSNETNLYPSEIKVYWENMWSRVKKETQPVIVRKMAWRKIAAAAIIILMLGAGIMWFTNNKKQDNIALNEKPKIKNDVAAPNTVNAVLTLGNGQRIILDSTGNGTLAMQGNVQVVKLDNGQIAYKASPNPSEGGGQAVYNTLSNPRGSKVINITLNDGSKVWLNAESSLRFPASFTGDERKVTITGEAYFEVAHLPLSGGGREGGRPFIVDVTGTEVKVLGTHFNINSYNDESAIKTTLLEGSVEVSLPSQRGGVRLKPGQQAIKTGDGKLTINNNVVIEDVMAWKNGLFNFNNADIQDIMRQAARWYDVEVIYEGAPSAERYKGKVARNTSLAEMMKILELNGVKYRIDGKKIILSQ